MTYEVFVCVRTSVRVFVCACVMRVYCVYPVRHSCVSVNVLACAYMSVCAFVFESMCACDLSCRLFVHVSVCVYL